MADTFPIRTKPFDENGNWSRPLVEFFKSLTESAAGDDDAVTIDDLPVSY